MELARDAFDAPGLRYIATELARTNDTERALMRLLRFVDALNTYCETHTHGIASPKEGRS